jgi:DMSO reductase family type II enzyme chaperone
MTDPTYRPAPVAVDSPEERRVAAEMRTPELNYSRCLLYASASDLAASPFDAEPVVVKSGFDINAMELPYELPTLQPVLDEWQSTDREVLKREYSGLFEVGNDGPPVPIREDLHCNQPAGLREDIVRFYEYFGYGLETGFAWAPDHLSVEFEFMHYLAFREGENLESDMAASYQLAQFDFCSRHLANWVPELAERVAL